MARPVSRHRTTAVNTNHLSTGQPRHRLSVSLTAAILIPRHLSVRVIYHPAVQQSTSHINCLAPANMSQFPAPPSNPNPYAYHQPANPYAAASATQPASAYYPPPQPPSQPTPAPPPPPPAPAANPSIPYIGALISLVSKALLRYEGTLYTIDPKASTVTLSHVRCFGSENRAAAAEFVPASSKVYEFIVFSGKDIHDLHVMQKQEAEQHDPAILSAKQQTTALPPSSATTAPRPAAPEVEDGELEEPAIGQLSLHDSSPQHSSYRGRGSRGGGHSYYNSASQSTNASQHQQQPKYTVSILSSRPIESHEFPQRQRGGGGSSGSGGGMASKDILKSEFDFASSNARFNKGDFVTQLQQQQQSEQKTDLAVDDAHTVIAPAYELPKVDDEVSGEMSGEAGAAPAATKPLVAVAYDKKKSFFDDLGNDKAAGSGGGGGGRGGRGGGGRQNDRETFGDVAVRGGRHRGGGRRGRVWWRWVQRWRWRRRVQRSRQRRWTAEWLEQRWRWRWRWRWWWWRRWRERERWLVNWQQMD